MKRKHLKIRKGWPSTECAYVVAYRGDDLAEFWEYKDAKMFCKYWWLRKVEEAKK